MNQELRAQTAACAVWLHKNGQILLKGLEFGSSFVFLNVN